jgi:hypothetical protein
VSQEHVQEHVINVQNVLPVLKEKLLKYALANVVEKEHKVK